MSNIPAFDPRWDGASIPKWHSHFHRKLFERYGIVLGPGDFADILKQIRSGEALRVEARREGAIYFVKVRSLFERIYVLSDGRHLITAWPATRKLLAKRKSLDT